MTAPDRIPALNATRLRTFIDDEGEIQHEYRVGDGTGLTRDRYHRYTFNGDGPLVGVTTPLKIQDTLIGGDLAAWGGGIAVDHILSVLATPPGLPPDSIQLANLLRSQALAKVAEARDIGTAVHARIEHILLGEPQSQSPCPRHPPEFGRVGACALLPDLVPPYIYAFSSFLAAYRPEFLFVEFMVVNLKHRYAGTGDIAARMPEFIGGRPRIALIDVKTGRQKASHKLQLAGYAGGEGIGREGEADLTPLPRFQDFYSLYLKPEGYELVQQDITRADRAHFYNLVKTYRRLREWDEANTNGVKP